MRTKLRLFVECSLLVAGVALLGIVSVALVHRSVSSRLALAEFDKDQAALVEKAAASGTPVDEKVDFSLWSAKRIREYRASLLVKKDAPMAVLRIEKLKVRVPVFEGTDDLVLNRGVGWIAGTARPGEPGNGNIGMAGHRDGFFRGFKDIAVGDAIELATPGVVSHYAVDHIEIVYPENVEVLRPRSAASLTLVTCYPSYFVGDAPQRFIVHATLKQQVGVSK
ncbi:MAG: class D sortase [Candidatus Solibacter sp.]|nr:class D sortase [Candidatus Solibacter sp.]